MKFENKISKNESWNFNRNALKLSEILRELTKLTLLNINGTNGGELLLTANPPKY